MAVGRHDDHAQRRPGDVGGVEHHVVEGEDPAPVGVRHLFLQDRDRADRDALPGEVQAEPDGQVRGLAEGLAQHEGHHGARDEQQRDPGGLGQPPGHRRGHQGGAGVADPGEDHERPEVALGHADARPVEVVPVEQDRHQEQRPEQEAEAAGHAERRRRAAPPDDVPGAVGQPGRDRGQLAAQPPAPGARVPARRAEPVAGHGGRDQARRHVTAAPGQQRDRGTALGVAGGHVEPQGDDTADDRRDAADGRRYRVGHHQLVARPPRAAAPRKARTGRTGSRRGRAAPRRTAPRRGCPAP